MTAQEQVFRAVESCGYYAGWSNAQFLFRQALKLTEELAEAMKHLSTAGPSTVVWDYRDDLERAGDAARILFDGPTVREFNITVDDPAALRKELADAQVVLMCAAQALERLTGEPFDVVQAAVDKATADVSRGVRGG